MPAEVPPRETSDHPLAETREDKLVAFSDASHAPLNSTGRRGGYRRGNHLSRISDQNAVMTPTVG